MDENLLGYLLDALDRDARRAVEAPPSPSSRSADAA